MEDSLISEIDNLIDNFCKDRGLSREEAYQLLKNIDNRLGQNKK